MKKRKKKGTPREEMMKKKRSRRRKVVGGMRRENANIRVKVILLPFFFICVFSCTIQYCGYVGMNMILGTGEPCQQGIEKMLPTEIIIIGGRQGDREEGSLENSATSSSTCSLGSLHRSSKRIESVHPLTALLRFSPRCPIPCYI